MAAMTASAQDGVAIGGYARTKVGALIDGGDYFVAENTLDLRLSYTLGDAGFYANPVLYERDGDVEPVGLREAYIDLSGESFDVRIGKQQIIWGKGDGVFITDIVSPKDLSQFLIPDFEELRLAVTGAKVNLHAGTHEVELVWLPWFEPSVSPDTSGIWAPTMPFTTVPTIVPGSPPSFNLGNGEYFASYSWMGSSFDVSLMGGWFWNDTPVYKVVALNTVAPEYYQLAAGGYAVSGALGPFILRSEGAFYANKRFQASPMVFSDGYAEKNAIQYLAGVDFSVAGYNFGVQFIQDIILDHEDGLFDDALKNTATFVVSRTFFRETLTAEVFSYIGFETPDALIKPKLTWDVSDGMEIFGGAYMFLGDSGDFGQYDANDGLYAGAKFSF
jgi:hypothetical protein